MNKDKQKILESLTDLLLDDQDYMFFGMQGDGGLVVSAHGDGARLTSILAQSIIEFPDDAPSKILLGSVVIATLMNKESALQFGRIMHHTKAEMNKELRRKDK